MKLKVFLMIFLMSKVKSTSLRRSRRSIVTDGGHLGDKCAGNLKLVTTTETRTFNKSMARVMVKNISRVVVEGSCCGTIYSGVKFRGKSHSITKPGKFRTRVQKAKSVILRNC